MADDKEMKTKESKEDSDWSTKDVDAKHETKRKADKDRTKATRSRPSRPGRA